MNGKKTLILFVFLTMLAFSPLIAKVVHRYNSDHFSCLGRINIISSETNFNAQAKYSFDGDHGEVAVVGELSKLGERTQRISQQLLFNYTRNGNEIIMLSKNSALSDNQARMLVSLVPDFYLFKDRGLRIRIYQQGDGYVFTTFNIPVFICTKI
ncbi:hypothetical protein CH54_2381 [Yersinia rochesterensis]|uniref:Uncharacterized protein n=1 Tax=Yersinia rochesterensis TaxID=1604335 RepID=A0A8D4N8E9_9GAMM|nr:MULTISPECIES: hypothetical protein [Yersinia]AJI85497.1 hypothetical protein AW19_3409 [Yersinia frederiksenii Y225]CRY61791.1 Uncharacterised protein [Yersinia kristensenii]AIN18821.1 hypothetical protein DJ57_3244 [Yersinia rochesterensis]AJJ37500.1 hypothetical protein CH54_2381 [Yersinia rochesterensis]AYD45702.1 hypothetical protein DXZ79_19660 [Yersinia rochesterensis]